MSEVAARSSSYGCGPPQKVEKRSHDINVLSDLARKVEDCDVSRKRFFAGLSPRMSVRINFIKGNALLLEKKGQKEVFSEAKNVC